MKKIILFLLQVTLVLAVQAQLVYKQATTNLYLRENSGSHSKILAIIPKGTKIIVQENQSNNSDWGAVDYNGRIGYVSTKYLGSYNSDNSSYNRYQPILRNNSTVKYYKNSFGEKVQSPTYYNSPPAGATALCRDGTYSFSQSRTGTCSHHGGVAKWLK